MPAYINHWTWRLTEECLAEATPDPTVLYRSHWGSFEPVQLEIGLVFPIGCERWSQIEFRAQDPGLVSGSIPILRPGSTGCSESSEFAVCVTLDRDAPAGRYSFEATVSTEGVERRSIGVLELRD
ncbi:MAG: hypothetical protein AAGD38_11115 [Acidobacteriota bacterium]